MSGATPAIVCVVGALLGGCAPRFGDHVRAPAEPSCNGSLGSGGLRAMLATRACDGRCPVYRLVLCGDGTVIYDGSAYVIVHGRRTRKLTPATLDRLARTLDELPDGPGPLGDPLGGGPRGHVATYRDGVRRFVAVTTPRGEPTADVVERLVGSVEWVGTEAQREAAWRASH